MCGHMFTGFEQLEATSKYGSPPSPAAGPGWWSTSAAGPAPAHGSSQGDFSPAPLPNGDLNEAEQIFKNTSSRPITNNWK